MKVFEWSQPLIAPLRDVLAKFSPSQRISMVVLAVTVVLGISLLVFTGSDATASDVIANATNNPSAIKFLDDRRIPYQVDKESGNVVVSAAGRDEFYAAGVQQVLDTETDEFDWIFDSQGWQESLGRMRLRSIESTRKRLEKTLSSTRDIKKAVIIVHKPASEDWSIGRNERASSASVMLTPKSPKGLSSRQAHMIASLVSGAFHIPLDKIQVADHNGIYAISSTAGMSGTESSEREQSIKDKVCAHYAEFQPSEIRVSVNVKIDATSSSTVSQRYKEDGSFVMPVETSTETRQSTQPSGLDPGVERNVSGLNKGTEAAIVPASYRDDHKVETTRSVPAISSEKQEMISPPSQERQINILVSFSDRAVRSVLSARKARELNDPAGAAQYNPTAEEIDQFVKARGEDLRVLFSDEKLPNVVHTSVFYPPAPFELVQAEPETWGAFAMAHIRELVLGFLALCACLLVYRIAFSSIPELEQLPDPVAEITQFLREREEQERQMAIARAKTEEERTQEDPSIQWEMPAEDKDVADLLTVIGGRAGQEPRSAAAVVKQWLLSRDRERPRS